MKTIASSNRDNYLAGLMLVAVGIAMIVLPWAAGFDGLRGGFAISFLGTFVVFCGIISILMFMRLTRLEKAILGEKNLLAHWTYSADEWAQLSVQEHAGDKNNKWRAFLLALVFLIIAGTILWVIYNRDVLLNTCIVLGIVVYLGLAADVSIFFDFLHKRRQGEAYIAKDGAFLDRRLYVWHGPMTRFMRAFYEVNGQSQPVIRIEYSYLNPAVSSHSARIPVPRGHEEAARAIAARIQASQSIPHTPRIPRPSNRPGIA